MARPPTYETPEEMQVDIDKYFDDCEKGKDVTIIRKNAVVTVNKQIPKTIAGLALALGFIARQSLLDYSNKDKFSETITRAKLQVENDTLIGAMTGEYEAKMSALNLAVNFGYVVKTEISDFMDTVSGVLKQIHKGRKAHRISKKEVKQLPQSSTQSKSIDAVPIPGHDTD